MFLSAFGILCGFALVVFAAASRPSVTALISAAAAAAVTWFIVPAGRLPDPVWSATLVFAVTALLLWRPELTLVASAASGAAAAAWLVLLLGQGLPLPAGLAVVLGLAVTVFALRWRSARFAPANLVEEALLIIAACAIIVAGWPAVTSGYRSALVFTAERVSAPAATSAPWALQLSISLLVLGGLYGFWKRR